MFDPNGFPPSSFQGSTEFYDSIQTDEFTPSSGEIGPLDEAVGKPWTGDEKGPPWIVKFPPWTDENPPKSHSQQYVEWFNGIWHTGDPHLWSEQVFTDRAVMIDPSGVSTGAKQAADSFLLLFKYFPGLRGLVVSWASNDREIIINWRFQIIRKGNNAPFLVPVIDKFCFKDGRVSFRLANYDIITLLGYLSQTYGVDQLVDFLKADSRQATKTGGIQRLPSILWNLVSGLLYWPHPTPTDLKAKGSNGVVTLTWKRIENETIEGYRVCRSEDLDGDYKQLHPGEDLDGDDNPLLTTYEDRSFAKEISHANPNAAPRTIWQRIWPRTTTYWYTVSPIIAKWRPVEVTKENVVIVSQSRTTRLAGWGYSLE